VQRLIPHFVMAVVVSSGVLEGFLWRSNHADLIGTIDEEAVHNEFSDVRR
jgi:hypothetical protein